MERPIILASSSPRRRELLAGLNLRFQVHPSDADESYAPGSKPHEIVESLSLRKAKSVARSYEKGLVIGSDTIVVLDGEVLGKPRDTDDAFKMLSKLQGRIHEVFSGVVIVDVATGVTRVAHHSTFVKIQPLSDEQIKRYTATTIHLGDVGQYRVLSRSSDGKPEVIVGHTVSKVTFRPMSNEEIEAYVKTGEPLDKAGSYGAQGFGAVFIEKIEGDFFSVMGLPLNLLYQMLLQFGISPFTK